MSVTFGVRWKPPTAGGSTEAVVTGAFASTRNVVEPVALDQPALSVVRKSTVCEPSPLTTNGAVYGWNAPPSRLYSVSAIPDVASTALSVTVGFAGRKPPSPGVPLTFAVIVGAVVSRLTFTETGPAEPTTFVAVQERVKFPSVENVSSAQPVFVVSAPPSVTCQASAILPDVYQPFGPFGAAGSSV